MTQHRQTTTHYHRRSTLSGTINPKNYRHTEDANTMAKYTINFAPVDLTGRTRILVGRQPFDATKLEELRSNFNDTHVFRRDGVDNSIVDIPIVSDQAPIGQCKQELDLLENKKFLVPLLSASLIRVFLGRRDIVTASPVRILGAESQGFVRHPRLPNWLQKRTLQVFDSRTIYRPGYGTVFGLVLQTRLRNIIGASCTTLLEHNISIVGRYVQIQETSDSPFLPTRRLVGRVACVQDDGELVLEDHLDGFGRIAADRCYLEPRREVFDACVRYLLGREASDILAAADTAAVSLHLGTGRMEQIERNLKYLQDEAVLEAVPGASFRIGSLLSSGSRLFPDTEVLSRPVLFFDPSGSRRDIWNERGLRKNGPYDQRTFTPKQLNIAVICQARYEGQVDRFVAKFLDGMPDTRTGSGDRSTARYGDGFIRRFGLETPNVVFFPVATSSSTDYVAASRSALEHATDNGFAWNLALVQVEEEFKALDGDLNPYFSTKSVFLKRDVAVQSVRLETMGQPDGTLVFSMNHLSLATYAKVGGVPWLLSAQQTVAHELVIGLGSHSTRTSRIGPERRHVGITTVFSSDGSYLLSDKTAVVPFEDYADALYDTLTRSITTVREQDNWRSSDRVRLIFHVFKPFKDLEADAIKRTVEDLSLNDVAFAFVHVAPGHPYLVFDLAQKGIGFGSKKKGVLGPTRGLHIKLSDFESLVVFSGASELKQPTDGMPRPCLLRLHRLSTFTDMTYIARQAFDFSGHSWRMLAPEPYPITTRYSDWIAERLSGLNEVPDWDDDAIQLGRIGRTLWFL